jgi:integrase
MAIAGMQPQLGTPGEIDELTRQVSLACLEFARHAWGMPRMVGRFTQHVAQQASLATSAAAGGASERVIMAQTGHRSADMVRRYIREGNLWRENAASLAGL